MTIGQLVESIFGKMACIKGCGVDSTAFLNKGPKDKIIGEVLNQFDYHSSGNELMYNGMTGEQIESAIFIGPTYYMRLKHMVKDKINYRARGPRTNLTRQPVSGRANDGGLRIGEMERDAVISHGASIFLSESMMERGDKYQMAICNKTGMIAVYNPARNLMLSPMIDGPLQYTGSLNTSLSEDIQVSQISRYGRDFSVVSVPYSFKLLIQELQAMNIRTSIITEDNISQIENMGFSKNINHLLFDENMDILEIIKQTTEKIRKVEEMGTRIAESDLRTIADTNSEDFVLSKENSPEFNRPVFNPMSPEESPEFNPQMIEKDSPQYNHEASYEEDSPEYHPPRSPDGSPPFRNEMEGGNKNEYGKNEYQNQNYQKGGKVHYRGDNKPNREWTIDHMGNKLITITTDDIDGLGVEDSLKVVDPSEIYPRNQEYVYMNTEPSYPYESDMNTYQPYQNQFMSEPILPDSIVPEPNATKIHFAPVIKIFNEGNDMSQGENHTPENGQMPIDSIVNPFGIKTTQPLSAKQDVVNMENILPDFNKNIIIKKI
jgi:hypothetical protein